MPTMQDVTADYSYAQIIADLSKNSELLERYIVNDGRNCDLATPRNRKIRFVEDRIEIHRRLKSSQRGNFAACGNARRRRHARRTTRTCGRACKPLATIPYFFCKPSFDQRLIGNIAFVGGNLYAIKKYHRQAQRNRGRRRLEIWYAHPLRFAPVNILAEVCVSQKRLSAASLRNSGMDLIFLFIALPFLAMHGPCGYHSDQPAVFA